MANIIVIIYLVLFYCLWRADAEIQSISQLLCIRRTCLFTVLAVWHGTTGKTQEHSYEAGPSSFAPGDSGWFVAEGIWSKVS